MLFGYEILLLIYWNYCCIWW